jgi:hypothetical protein
VTPLHSTHKYHNDIYFSRLYVNYHCCLSWCQECVCLLMVPIVVVTVFIHPTIPKSNLIIIYLMIYVLSQIQLQLQLHMYVRSTVKWYIGKWWRHYTVLINIDLHHQNVSGIYITITSLFGRNLLKRGGTLPNKVGGGGQY